MRKPSQGSVLVFSLIILSIILSAAITVATVSLTNQRSATATGKSVQSFQVADSGIELTLQKIYKGSATDLNTLASNMGGSCSNGVIGSINIAGGNVQVSFFDNNNARMTDCTSTTWRDEVVKIKSEGTAFGTTRVVETAVAAASENYSTSCFGSPTTSNYFCCQMDKSDGGASCDYSTDRVNWNNFSRQPFSATSAGLYDISCFASDGSGSDILSCCRTETVTGTTECSATNSPTGSWTTYTNQPNF